MCGRKLAVALIGTICLSACRGEVLGPGADAAHEPSDGASASDGGGARFDAQVGDSGASSAADAAAPDAGAADASSSSPSGETMPVGDIPGWRQIFADDFLTDVPVGNFPSAVSAKWDAYPDGWKDTSKHGTYFPSKVVSIQNGVLNLHLHTENGVHMVSAPEPK